MKTLKEPKVVTEVKEIINSNLHVWEKWEALKKINYHCIGGAEARGWTSGWKGFINGKRMTLPCHNIKINEQREFFNSSSLYYASMPTDTLKTIEEELKLINVHFHPRDIVADIFESYRDGRITRKQAAKELGKQMRPYFLQRKENAEIIEQRKEENKKWETSFGFQKYGFFYYTYNIEHLIPNGAISNLVIGNYAFCCSEIVDKDWNYYSKSWHSAYGPKRTVSDRIIKVRKLGRKDAIKKYHLPRWSQSEILKVIAETFGVTEVKLSKDLKKFQTSKYFDVKKSKKVNGYQIYKQTIGKYTIGHVAYDAVTDTHYHDYTIEDAVQGLTSKIEKAAQDKIADAKQIVTADYAHKRWGFCFPGMTEFAEAAGLDINGSYSIAELKKATQYVSRYIKVKYSRELKIAKLI